MYLEILDVKSVMQKWFQVHHYPHERATLPLAACRPPETETSPTYRPPLADRPQVLQGLVASHRPYEEIHNQMGPRWVLRSVHSELTQVHVAGDECRCDGCSLIKIRFFFVDPFCFTVIKSIIFHTTNSNYKHLTSR